MDETKILNDYISESDLKYRKDCRTLLTYTIDGAESKDLDDAISLEKTDSGHILYVHIADVSHYVREDTPLDREARKRGTSIYLADQVIPMLPTEISNGLCSLHPGEDKLTLTCEMHISKSGQVTKSEVYNSVIISDYRLTYKEIDEFVSEEIKF
jgi:ribonuclease R